MTPKQIFGTIFLVSVAGLGIGLATNSNRKKRNALMVELEAAKRAREEAEAKAAGMDKPATPSNYGATPFKNADEGNRFRKWLNLSHPDDAKKLQIDLTGAYDNAYIRKAFYQFGAEYFNFLTSVNNLLEADKLKQQLAAELLKNTVAKKVVLPKANTATVRSTPAINDGYVNNRLFTLTPTTPADYLADVKGTDQLTWYKVKLDPKYNGGIGYVRSDVAQVKTIRVPV